MTMQKQKLFVVSGPSGAGLGEIISEVFRRRSDVATVVPVTARKMKEGEQDGVGFFFYDLDGWNALKESGDLLEATEFAGNDYGTSKRLVEEQLAAGKHVLLNLDVARAAQLKRNMPEAVCIYIEPSSPRILEERYRPNCRSAFELSARMDVAASQRAESAFCDVRISSDDLQAAAEKLCALMD